MKSTCLPDCVVLLAMLATTAGCETGSSGKGSPAGDASPEKSVVTIFAAASTTNAVDQVKAVFTGETGIQVQASYAASSALAQQIANGAEPDIFLSANVGWADYVEEKVAIQQRRDLLGNRLVVIVAADSKLKLTSPEGLLSSDVKYLALGDPDAVPAGKYARQALVALNLWDRLKGKVAPAKDVRDALTYVETGAAEAAIVYATDAAVSDKVRVVAEIPPGLTEPVVYPVLLLKRSVGNISARAFYDYLGTQEAARIFEKYGFVVLAGPTGDSNSAPAAISDTPLPLNRPSVSLAKLAQWGR